MKKNKLHKLGIRSDERLKELWARWSELPRPPRRPKRKWQAPIGFIT